MGYTTAALLAVLACICATSSGYNQPVLLTTPDSQPPPQPGVSASHGLHRGHGHSKVHRPSKTVHSGGPAHHPGGRRPVVYNAPIQQVPGGLTAPGRGHAYGTINAPARPVPGRITVPGRGHAYGTINAPARPVPGALTAPGRGHAYGTINAPGLSGQHPLGGAHAALGAAHFRAQQAHQGARAGLGAAHFRAHQAHEEAHPSLGAAHFSAQQAHEEAAASLGAAHFSAQQAHEEAAASLGAAHFSAQQAHEEAAASLGAAHFSAQQAHEEAAASLGAAHFSAQQAHEEAAASLGAAHFRAQQAHEEAAASLGGAHVSAQEAHASVGAAHLDAQEAHGSAQASVGAAHLSAQQAYLEAQASAADARESVREAHARAQAAIRELAFFASQSKLALSTSYLLNHARIIVSRHFGPSHVKAPRIIVRDAATSGLVCVPASSFNASWVTPGGVSPAATTVHTEQRVTGAGSALAGGVQQTHSWHSVEDTGEEVQKAIDPFNTIGQGHGIMVTVTGTSAYGAQGPHSAGQSGYASASQGPSGVDLSVQQTVHGADDHEEFVSVHGGVDTEHGDTDTSGKLQGVPSSGGAGKFSSAGDASIHADYAETSSAQRASTTSGGTSASSADTTPVGSGSFTAGHASASPQLLTSTAGGSVTGAGGRVASASRSRYSSEHSGSAVSSSAHDVSGGGVRPVDQSSSSAAVSGGGRSTLYVAGQHAEAATVGADGSGVQLSSTGGVSHHGLAQCECVPDYLCDADGLINTSGVGLISVRSFSAGGGTEAVVDTRCPAGHVCCSHREQREPVGWRPLSCGTRSPVRLDRRVVSGEASRLGEFPWMVALMLSESSGKVQRNKYLCGGSLIAPDVVLTAAHCVHKHRTGRLVARLGEWDTSIADSVYPHRDVRVTQVVVHEQFVADTLYYDVALLKLSEPVETDAHINTICLPEADDGSIDYASCFATGWGQESFDHALYSNLLKKVPLSTVSSELCQSQLRETRLGKWFQLHDTFLCAGGGPGVDTCLGDGGSPLVCRLASGGPYQQEETFVQVGIVAWGINCHRAGVPGVYADVVRLLPWISSSLAALSAGAAY